MVIAMTKLVSCWAICPITVAALPIDVGVEPEIGKTLRMMFAARSSPGSSAAQVRDELPGGAAVVCWGVGVVGQVVSALGRVCAPTGAVSEQIKRTSIRRIRRRIAPSHKVDRPRMRDLRA